jgi:hypothetical protein
LKDNRALVNTRKANQFSELGLQATAIDTKSQYSVLASGSQLSVRCT